MLNNLTQLPPVLVVRACYFCLCGRIHFPKKRLGQVIHGKENFIIFRHAVLDSGANQPEKPGAILTVRFQFRRFSLKTNRKLSLIPIPFIIAQPGFRSKIWMSREKTGEFLGIYEWDTLQDAEKYRFSFPMKLMDKRAVPESLTYEIMEIG